MPSFIQDIFHGKDLEYVLFLNDYLISGSGYQVKIWDKKALELVCLYQQNICTSFIYILTKILSLFDSCNQLTLFTLERMVVA